MHTSAEDKTAARDLRDPGGEDVLVGDQLAQRAQRAANLPPPSIGGPGGRTSSLPTGIRGDTEPGAGRPLLGRRILVTRARSQAGDLSRALAELGAIPIESPAIRFEPPEDTAPLDAAIDRLDSYAWVIFTSANGVDRFCERLGDRGRDPRDLARARLVAIGDGTARALQRWDLTADIVPERFIAEAVVERLAREDLSGARILIPRAAEARDVLPRELAQLGATVDLVPVYRTVPASPDPAVLAMLAAGQIDVVTFTSSSTVTNLLAQVRNAEYGMRNDPLGGALVACIGPITAQTAREQGLRVDLVAEEHSIPGLVAALAEWATAPRREGSTESHGSGTPAPGAPLSQDWERGRG